MPTLHEIQRRFFELITAPEDVARTLERRGLAAAYVDEWARGDARRSAVGRLDIYAHMYFFRLLEILQGDHPAVAAALGEERFHNLAVDYLQAHPSEDPSVRRISSHLPEFLAQDDRRWLAELAALEQARLDCFDAGEAAALTLDDLLRASRSPQARGSDSPRSARLADQRERDLAALPLALVPATRRLRCRFAVDECWQAAQEGSPVTEPAEAPREILVWRRDVEVFHRVLEADEAALLDCGSFGLVCERLAETMPAEAAAQRAFALLARWVADGLVLVRP